MRVVLPADPVLGQPEQEVVARLWRRRQTGTGWVYLVGLPSYRDLENAAGPRTSERCARSEEVPTPFEEIPQEEGGLP